ncbi:MAG: Pyruvate dehydrogenase (ubiquinone) [candidate division BRC1 bacterium ADurb.BinA364]|nr:MAG: Pyruvate dehydrogenase (ubiquinone) [candidate division BRC1 bacterium ADurb.BinA364]
MADPQREVCALCGDGGFLMTAGEIATAARLGLPLTIVVFNDRALSLIDLKQSRKRQERHGVETGAQLGETGSRFLGVPVWPATDIDEFRAALDDARAGGGPAIVEARIDPSEYDGLILRGK